MGVILFKAVLVLVITFLGIQALRSPTLAAMPERAFIRRALALQLLPALALFMGLYVFGNQQVPSDVPTFYLPAARAVMAGQRSPKCVSVLDSPPLSYFGRPILVAWGIGE